MGRTNFREDFPKLGDSSDVDTGPRSESAALRGFATSALRTVSPAARYAPTRFVPMNPEPPVTKIRAPAGRPLQKSACAGLIARHGTSPQVMHAAGTAGPPAGSGPPRRGPPSRRRRAAIRGARTPL